MARVEEIMLTNVASVSPSAPIVEVAQKMRDCRIGTIPVCENGKLRGMITERSIISKVVAYGYNPKRERAKTLMSNNGPIISLGSNTTEAAKIMATHRVCCLPVVQNGGKFVGLLTLNNLVNESPALASMVLARANGDNPASTAREKVIA